MTIPCPEPVSERRREMMMTAGLVGSVSSLHRLESGTHLGAHDIFGYVDSNDVAGVQGLLTTERGPIYDVRYARNAEPLFATNFIKPDFDGCKRSFCFFWTEVEGSRVGLHAAYFFIRLSLPVAGVALGGRAGGATNANSQTISYQQANAVVLRNSSTLSELDLMPDPEQGSGFNSLSCQII